ncbi:TIGR02530 family flagellar biosynthesis protein [Sporosalibacterium faouarense]|uniref:TIGR02530 family flagellar biosynthesis protein n=1 Tax=Sporosalibacterium faouarense TaxID=516123 RepID=UPI00141C4E6C|nr:TIGR02530 family flagellar biosynthesis protein [Sporosalibacterium faouarense]MTI47994.1 flagellar protein [Bacillota bacterium]
MNKINPQVSNIRINNRNNTNMQPNIQKNNRKSFDEILHQINKESNDVKFSKHAVQRMGSRNINLDKDEVKRLENALSKAENKGIKEALILMDNKAFIASVKSKTIITTANPDGMNEKVFTNIDGAVII